MTENKKNPWAILPLVIFVCVYLLTSMIVGDFYKMPIIIAALVAVVVALVMNREVSLDEKLEIFCQGAGHSNILIMVLVFILAGAFAGVAREMGAVDATVNLFISILPAQFLVPGIFIMACFISISIGTSFGTITALAPMAVGLAQRAELVLPLVMAAVVGGAMFGDNLSMISDTTIAATRTQGCSMKDKFRTNFLIVLPAALVTMLIYLIIGQGESPLEGMYHFNAIKVLPYLFVLGAALLGVNVIVVLTSGVLLAGGIGIFTGSFDLWGFVASANNGIQGMWEIIILSLLIGGIVGLIKHNGGIHYVLELITKRIKTKKGAQLGIGILVALVDACTANNTIAIVTVGPIAKDIATKYDIKPRKSASILDTFSCFMQGVIPYGAQLLVAAGTAGIASIQIMQYLYYPYLMFICVIISIYLGRDK